MQGSEFKTWVQSFASCWQQCRGKHAHGPRAAVQHHQHLQGILEWHQQALEASRRPSSAGRMSAQQEGSEGEKRRALQQLISSVSWRAAVRKLHPRCPRSNLALRRGIPWKFLQRVQTATGKKPLRCSLKHQTKRLYAPETLKFL